VRPATSRGSISRFPRLPSSASTTIDHIVQGGQISDNNMRSSASSPESSHRTSAAGITVRSYKVTYPAAAKSSAMMRTALLTGYRSSHLQQGLQNVVDRRDVDVSHRASTSQIELKHNFSFWKPVQVVRRFDVDDLVIVQSRVVQLNRIEAIRLSENQTTGKLIARRRHRISYGLSHKASPNMSSSSA
jgi:hypothetical protein